MPISGEPEIGGLAFIRGDWAQQETSSHANARRCGRPGAIPTVDFLLYHPGPIVKKMAVKSQLGAATDSAES
jgi:hypothetical protein